MADHMAQWTNRWSDKRIAFHLPTPHPVLEKQIDKLELNENSRMLVPLCGKSVDLRYLAELGVDVVGVEGVQTALDDFLEENSATRGPGDLVQIGDAKLTYVVGDFFDFESEDKFTAVFDRGSLVAVDPGDRKKYVETITRNLAEKAKILLVSTEHDPFAALDGARKLGPPHSIDEDTIRELYQGFTITPLSRESKDEFKDRGCEYFFEAAYLLIRE